MQKMIGRYMHWCFSECATQIAFQHNEWMGNSSRQQSYQNESLLRYTGETQQGRLLAQNFSLLKLFQFPETAIYNYYKEILKSVSN